MICAVVRNSIGLGLGNVFIKSYIDVGYCRLWSRVNLFPYVIYKMEYHCRMVFGSARRWSIDVREGAICFHLWSWIGCLEDSELSGSQEKIDEVSAYLVYHDVFGSIGVSQND